MTELGNRLREARLAKGMSLDDLQTVTKIQKRYLVGIEEGNFSMMPGKFYVRAFIKQYAEAVGLHAEALFEEFKNEIPSSMNEDIPEKISRVKTRKAISDKSSKILDILPKVLIFIVVIGVIALVWFLAQKYAGNSSDNSSSTSEVQQQEVTYEESEDLTKDKQAEETTDEAKTDTTDAKKSEEIEVKPVQQIAVSQASGDTSIYDVTNAVTFQLKIVSTGSTWVSVKNATGTSLFQGMLKVGATESQTIDMTQETEAVMIIGNTAATDIYVNDQKLEYAIAPTSVVKQDITIRFVKSE